MGPNKLRYRLNVLRVIFVKLTATQACSREWFAILSVLSTKMHGAATCGRLHQDQ